MNKLSIIVPVYFNEASLIELNTKLDEVTMEALKLGISVELIFVDDGSKDNSYQVLRSIKVKNPSIRIIKLTRNFGAIAAVKTGLQFVTGDCFLFLAADLQDPPELIVKMLKLWLTGSKYIICERTDRNDPWSSRIFASVYYKVLRYFVARDYPKKGFDLALMDRVMLAPIINSGKHINLPLFPYWLGFKPEIIHYSRVQRLHGRSKWTFSKKFKLLIDSIFSFSFAPIRLISGIGVLVSIASFSYGVVVIISALIGKIAVPGFATLAAILSFLLGLIIIMLGIISEYVWRIFDEINKHPTAVIETIDE